MEDNSDYHRADIDLCQQLAVQDESLDSADLKRSVVNSNVVEAFMPNATGAGNLLKMDWFHSQPYNEVIT